MAAMTGTKQTARAEGGSVSKRWRPPPMNEAAGESKTPKVTLDEKVVRKMLQINPAMRDGRTTFQVKKDMEGGQAVRVDKEAPVSSSATPTATPAVSGTKSDLDETIGFFMKGKGAEVQEQLSDLGARRAALEAQEQDLRAQFTADVAKFLSMLDPKIVAMHGVTALSLHKDLLTQLGLTPAAVLEAVRKSRS